MKVNVRERERERERGSKVESIDITRVNKTD